MLHSPHPPAVTTTRITVWHAASSSSDPGPLEAACGDWLDANERDRAARFRVPTSRNQHIVGRGMARKLLAGEKVAPQSIRFATEVHGKPFVVHPESAQQPFNVSHTDGLVLCGIGSPEQALVGVDVERVGRRTDPGLADRFFSPPEIDYLNRLPSGDGRRNAFLRIWTLKESFIKAIGTGLQTPLADFAFVDPESDSPTIQMLDSKLESDLSWRFFSVQPRPGFVAAIAVAVDRVDTPVSLELRRFDDLIDAESH